MTNPVTTDPTAPRIIFDIRPAMAEAGYWHETGRFAGTPHMTALQQRTGITYTTINDLVNHGAGIAQISLDIIARLCAALDCTPNDIMTLEVPNATPATPLEAFFRENPTADPYAQSRDPALSRF